MPPYCTCWRSGCRRREYSIGNTSEATRHSTTVKDRRIAVYIAAPWHRSGPCVRGPGRRGAARRLPAHPVAEDLHPFPECM
ncbi:hypothetical protein GCM10009526_04220 [Glutamicibacter creatinolyticus]